MWLKGYNGTSVKDIVVEAGIPKGSFYNYFDSKEAFAVEALRCFVGWGKERTDPILKDTSLSPLERLRKLYDYRIDTLKNEMQNKRGCFASNLAQEMGDVNERLGNIVHKAFEELKQPLVDCIREAVEQGELPEDTNAKELVDFSESAFRGAMMDMKVTRSAKSLEVCRKYIFEKLLV